VVHPTWVGADIDSWGIDHGTWSVLVHAFPEASIPVVQLSINADKPLDYHLELGAKAGTAAGKRSAGHRQRQRRAQPARHAVGAGRRRLRWAQRFDEAAKEPHVDEPHGLRSARRPPRLRARSPHPGPLHPRLYLAGLAGAAGEDDADTRVLVDGYAYGSLSMTAYTLGMACPQSDGIGGSPQPPSAFPPDESNI
jgi:4,5-DOPA dioxygenase extradiol